jgi:parallel beta-helix repeat protein
MLDKLYIFGEDGLQLTAEDMEFPGDGSKEHPYIIEGYEIRCSSVAGIELVDIKSYVIIRNCTFYRGGEIGKGISLYKARNIIIERNKFVNLPEAIYASESSFRAYKNIISAEDHGFEIRECSSFLIEDNDITSRGECIYVSNSRDANIHHNTIHGSRRDAIRVLNDCNRIIISENDIFSNKNGVNVSNSGEISVEGNKFSHNKSRGISLSGVWQGVVRGNLLTDTGNPDGWKDAAIFLSNCKECTVDSNRLERNINDGIRLDYTKKSVVSKNECTSSELECGLEITGSSIDNKVLDNAFFNCKKYGISLGHAAYRNLVSGNTCSNNGMAGICLASELGLVSKDNYISENCCYNNGEAGITSSGEHTYIDGNDCRYNGIYGMYIREEESYVGRNVCEYNPPQILRRLASEIKDPHDVPANISVVKSKRTKIMENKATFGAFLGILIYESEYIELGKNTSSYNSGDGIMIHGGTDEMAAGVIVSNNECIQNAGHGISLMNIRSGWVLEDNLCQGNGGCGIWVGKAMHPKIDLQLKDNKCLDNVYRPVCISPEFHAILSKNGEIKKF